PELLLQLVANQIATGFDPSENAHGNDNQRAAIVAEARRHLADRSSEQRHRFETALRRAERAYPIREDNLFYILFTPMGLVRRAALEMGRRMRERGHIERTSDVFYLREDELTDAVSSGDGLADLVVRRRGEEAWVLAHPGPASYGEAPGEPPSVDFLPAEARHATNALLALIDLTMGHHDHTPGDGAILAGIAASAGRYTGTVRVIHNEHEFDKLRAGDVLVCPMTSPTWSVLFPSVGALVTDAGGILNHPAIIAREYRIPAVVATGDATERLQDGQIVTVDGSAGTVEAT
ncbi:MAG: PEP-utilizing enzyme, partial [Acidimicrobiia bacterium]